MVLKKIDIKFFSHK